MVLFIYFVVVVKAQGGFLGIDPLVVYFKDHANQNSRFAHHLRWSKLGLLPIQNFFATPTFKTDKTEIPMSCLRWQ